MLLHCFFPENISRLWLHHIYVLVTLLPLPELITINTSELLKHLISSLKLYTSLVRPHTEHACAVWDPRLSKNILRYTEICSESLSHELESRPWPFPQSGSSPTTVIEKEILKLCLLFIFTGKVAYHDFQLVRRLSPYPNRLQNSLQLSPLHARTDHFKHSFFFHHLSRPELPTLWRCQQELIVVL